MIIKVVRGDYFPGLVDYIMRWGQYASAEETPRVLAHPGLFSAKTAAAELWLQASLAPDRTQRAIHFIGRAEKGLADEQYRETARRILADAYLSDRPYLLVLHDDDGHFHLATVEVDEQGDPPSRRMVSRSLKREVTSDLVAILPHGDVVSRSWDSHLAWRLTKVSRQVEIDFGLRRLGTDRDTFDKVRIPIWQLKKETEEGLVPLATALGDEMKAALDLPAWQERSDALAMLGLGLRPYDGANKRRQGLQIYALGDPSHFCNASQLGKAYGLGTLERRSEEPFREWCGRQPAALSIERLAEADQGTTAPYVGAGKGDPALLRLKQQFDEYRGEHRRIRKLRREISNRHRDEQHKDGSVVGLVREKLLATGRVSKSWARVICQIVRQELLAKTLARQLREKATLVQMGRRQLKWPEFLAEAAAHDPDAHRVHEHVRRKLSPHERSIERARVTSDANARSDEHDRMIKQAQAIEAEAQESANRREREIQIEEERFAIYQRRKRLRALEPELVEKVRLGAAEDWVPVMVLLEKRPEDLDAIMHPSVRDHVKVMMADILDEQAFRLRKVLKFIESVSDRKILRGDRVDAMSVEDVQLRSYVRSTATWSEVKNAVRERDALLRGMEKAIPNEPLPEASIHELSIQQPTEHGKTEPVVVSSTQDREGAADPGRPGSLQPSASADPKPHALSHSTGRAEAPPPADKYNGAKVVAGHKEQQLKPRRSAEIEAEQPSLQRSTSGIGKGPALPAPTEDSAVKQSAVSVEVAPVVRRAPTASELQTALARKQNKKSAKEHARSLTEAVRQEAGRRAAGKEEAPVEERRPPQPPVDERNAAPTESVKEQPSPALPGSGATEKSVETVLEDQTNPPATASPSDEEDISLEVLAAFLAQQAGISV